MHDDNNVLTPVVATTASNWCGERLKSQSNYFNTVYAHQEGFYLSEQIIHVLQNLPISLAMF